MSESAFPLRWPQAPAGLWRLRSDEQLARWAAQGEERAFAEIFRRYGDSLYRFCLATTGNPHDAQDALQNAMVKALRALPGEQREIKLKPWLYRVARNESIEVMRRRPENEQLDPEQLTGGSAADAAETRERLRALLADLELLSERQRAVLLMRELSGLDFADIGAAYDTSAAAARQTLYEARLSLRELAEGRERHCADVRRELSDGGGHAIGRRKIRAHLRDCAECRAFGDAIAERRKYLAAIAPLPLGASLALLRSVLGASGGGGGTGGGALAGSLAPAAQTLAAPALIKSAAAVTLVVASVTVAGRAGIVDLSGSGGGSGTARSRAAAPAAGAAGSPRSEGSAAAPTRTQPVAGAPPQAPAAGSGDTRTSPAAGDRSPAASRQPASAPVAVGAPRGPTKAPDQPRAGQSPPGGGYGESASGRHGRPEQPPAAADAGSQTAAEHRPEHVPAPPDPPPSPAHPGGGLPADPPVEHPTPPLPPPSPPSAGRPESGGPPTGPPTGPSVIRPEN